MKKVLFATLSAVALMYSVPSWAENYEDLRNDWAVIKYRTADDQKIDAMTELKAKADAAANSAPDSAETLIWDGIITSSLAGLKGGLGALSLAKEARDKLEKADKLNPKALNGSAKTSLGALYYQVPGWPVGFGSDKKAKSYLEAALSIDPNGIDANYFYADYLYNKQQYADAMAAIEKVMSAPPREGREVADAGRKEEAKALLAKISAKIAK